MNIPFLCKTILANQTINIINHNQRQSFGGFGSVHSGGVEGRRGDFSIFRTKSGLLKQNSLLPAKKESGELGGQRNDGFGLGFGGAEDESVNTSVPAGRYFAALRGPELDQVKVRNSTEIYLCP